MSDDLFKYSKDTQNLTVAYFDDASIDFSDSDDSDTALLLSSVLDFIPQETKLNPLYYYFSGSFTVQSSHIMASPYLS